MKTPNDAEVLAALAWGPLITALEEIVVDSNATAPARTVHSVPTDSTNDAAFLIKPGWVTNEIIGVKAVTYFPDNGQQGMSTIQAGYMLFNGKNGALIGACDANVLTTRRTAAASAVAAKRLARKDSKHLLIVGSGALAPMSAQAHAYVRNYNIIEIWGRDEAKAQLVVDDLLRAQIGASGGATDGSGSEELTIRVSTDLDASVSQADVISCVTGSTVPLVKGALLKDGCHVDLIGSFTPAMRESDDDVVIRCSGMIFVDTNDALKSGDMSQPLEAGILTTADVTGNFQDLVSGKHPGRSNVTEMTLFKSAGFALQDLAAARLVFAGGKEAEA